VAATKRTLDFTNVKDAGQFNPRHKTPGDYRMKIVKVDDHVKGEGREKKTMWVFTIVLVSDKRATYPYYCGFDDKTLWKIRNLGIAAGLKVPKSRVGFDPNKLVNREIGASLDDEEYEGRKKSVIVATFPVSELSSDEPEPEDDDTEADDDDEDLEDIDLEEV
jgi:hypothetical protein